MISPSNKIVTVIKAFSRASHKKIKGNFLDDKLKNAKLYQRRKYLLELSVRPEFKAYKR
jgi:hypothetical protein